MNAKLSRVPGVLLRIVLMPLVVIVLAVLLMLAWLVLLASLLRLVWARLSGKPLRPWTFRVDRRAVWNRFYRTPGQRQRAPTQRDEADIIDIEPKEVQPPQR